MDIVPPFLLKFTSRKASSPLFLWCGGNVNLVIKQQIASGNHFCISLTIAPLNVDIGVVVKPNTPMISSVIKSL